MTDINYTMVAFEVVISVRGKPTETLPLDNFDGSGAQFLRFVASYVKSMPDEGLIKDNNRYYGEPDAIVPAGETYSCRLISGTSGIDSRFRRKDRTEAFRRTGDDIEEIEFGVYLLQPPAAHVGFLLMERVGGRTVARAFRTTMIDHFKRVYPELILTLTRTAETDAWKAAEEAAEKVSVKKITAIHRGIEASAMQELGLGGTARKLGEYQRVFKFREEPESGAILKKARNFLFPPVATVSADGGTVSVGPEGESDGGENDDEVDELIAEVSYAGSPPRSIRYSGARPPLISYPVEVLPSEDAPVAFLRAAKKIAKNLVDTTDCRLESGWDTGDWKDYEDLPTWKVEGFAANAVSAPESGD